MNSSFRIATSLLAFGLSSLAALAADPSGTWKFSAEGPQGREIDATLTLKLADGRLSGEVVSRAGKAAISDATLAGDQVSFSVVREFGRFLRKKKIVTRYSGKLTGDKIEGTVQLTGRDDKTTSLPWIAERTK